MDKLYLYSSMTYCCASEESNDHPDVFKAKFVVSDFSVNRNNVKLNQNTFPTWMNTLVGKPLVGKLATPIIGEADFTGHNMKETYIIDKDGNKQKTYEFDTQAFGVFTEVGIETIDNKEYIVAKCDIWKRFPKACSVIEKRIAEGTLNTSWEIDIISSHKETIDGSIVKVIDQGNFIGHCLLGRNTVPAYDCSKLLEVAEANEQNVDEELSGALSQDVLMLRDISKKDNLEKEEIDLHLKDSKESSQSAVDNSVNSDTTSFTDVDNSACDPEKKKEEAACNPDPKKEEDAACDPKKEKEDAACDPGPKKKEDAACDPEKKEKETSTELDQGNGNSVSNSEMEQSASGPKLTSNDLTCNIYKALEHRKIYSYIEFHFPLDKTIWVRDDSREAGQLDYIVFTYEVNSDGSIALSEPQPACLTVEFKEMNAKFNEMVNAIAQANAEITEKDREIASLIPYKKQVEEESANKAAIERAEKVDALRKYALNSMLISEAEISEGGQFAELVEDLNETAIKTVIAERYMNKQGDGLKKSIETSSTTNYESNVVKHDLTSFQDESTNNYKTVLRSYFEKK